MGWNRAFYGRRIRMSSANAHLACAYPHPPNRAKSVLLDSYQSNVRRLGGLEEGVQVTKTKQLWLVQVASGGARQPCGAVATVDRLACQHAPAGRLTAPSFWITI